MFMHSTNNVISTLQNLKYFLMIKFCDICSFAPGPDVISANCFFVRQEIDFYFPALVHHLNI